MSDRFFMARNGEIEVVDIPDSVSAAMDIMTADRVPADRAAELCWAAHRSGRDPEAFARHFVELRRAIR
ncbi:MAG TPA: hypothetical protein VNH17_17350 [Streptosporangiaceae bacterium]|nr:hypothetical protein [Streptosporangiaceae bacterium]